MKKKKKTRKKELNKGIETSYNGSLFRNILTVVTHL